MSLRSKRKLLFGAVAVAAVAALSLSGCSSNGSSTKSNGAKGATSVTVFDGRVGNFTENFNPFNNTGGYLSPTNGVL